jgi:hypothetical protein
MKIQNSMIKSFTRAPSLRRALSQGSAPAPGAAADALVRRRERVSASMPPHFFLNQPRKGSLLSAFRFLLSAFRFQLLPFRFQLLVFCFGLFCFSAFSQSGYQYINLTGLSTNLTTSTARITIPGVCTNYVYTVVNSNNIIIGDPIPAAFAKVNSTFNYLSNLLATSGGGGGGGGGSGNAQTNNTGTQWWPGKQGMTNANNTFAGTFTGAFSGAVSASRISADSGAITSDGSGNLTVGGTASFGGAHAQIGLNGSMSFDTANISSDGDGDLNVNGIVSSAQLQGYGSFSSDAGVFVSDGEGDVSVASLNIGGITTLDGAGDIVSTANHDLQGFSNIIFDGGKITTDGNGHLAAASARTQIITNGWMVLCQTNSFPTVPANPNFVFLAISTNLPGRLFVASNTTPTTAVWMVH